MGSRSASSTQKFHKEGGRHCAGSLAFTYKNKTYCKIIVNIVAKYGIILLSNGKQAADGKQKTRRLKHLQNLNKENDAMTSKEFDALARAIMYAANKADTLDELREALAEILGEQVPDKSE